MRVRISLKNDMSLRDEPFDYTSIIPGTASFPFWTFKWIADKNEEAVKFINNDEIESVVIFEGDIQVPGVSNSN